LKMRRLNSDSVFVTGIYVFFIVLLFIMLYPFWYVIMSSFSDPQKLAELGNVGFLPRGFSIIGYQELLLYKLFPRYILNTIIYLTLGTFLRISIASLMGYVLSVDHFFARKVITALLVITMFISGGLIPYYVLIRSLKGLDTIWVMVVPGAIDVYTCIVFRTFFKQLPGELKDSAFIDGANDLVMLFRIILPISKPLLATFAIFSIVGYWNSWFDALLFLRKIEMHPIQMFLRNLIINMMTLTSGESGSVQYKITGAEMLMKTKIVRSASIVVTTLPIMLVYPFFQKYFTKGIIVGSLKG